MSLIGIGKYTYFFIEKTKAENFFEYPIYGSLSLIIFACYTQIFIGGNYFINFFIFFLGLIFYFFYKKNFNVISIKYLNLFFLLLFSGLLISKTHEDFNLYHLFSVKELFENNLRIGVNILNKRFFHSSLFNYEQILYVYPLLKYKLIHLPVYFIAFFTCSLFFLSFASWHHGASFNKKLSLLTVAVYRYLSISGLLFYVISIQREW